MTSSGALHCHYLSKYTFIFLLVAGYVYDPHEPSRLDVEQDETLGVGYGQERRVGVDADGLVAAQAVLEQVQVDLIHQRPVVTRTRSRSN